MPVSQYQLFQYPILLPSAASLRWETSNRSIRGYLEQDVIIEYYGFSGSQVKYYPRIQDAQWHSEVFQLEPLPPHLSDSLLDKTATYFPHKWAKANTL